MGADLESLALTDGQATRREAVRATLPPGATPQDARSGVILRVVRFDSVFLVYWSVGIYFFLFHRVRTCIVSLSLLAHYFLSHRKVAHARLDNGGFDP